MKENIYFFQDFRKHKKIKEFQLPEFDFELTVDIIINILECLQGSIIFVQYYNNYGNYY